jgi:hypothetical protein
MRIIFLLVLVLVGIKALIKSVNLLQQGEYTIVAVSWGAIFALILLVGAVVAAKKIVGSVKDKRNRKKSLFIPAKVDLDLCGAGLLLGASREDKVTVVRGKAPAEALADPKMVCIECGGSGNTRLNNWDHHEAGGPTKSATRQAWNYRTEQCGDSMAKSVWELVCYIDRLDTQGPQSLPKRGGFPSLADVFAGLLLSERDPKEQFFKGIELLKEVLKSGQNPYGKIRGFGSYASAKAENDRQVAEAVKSASWGKTRSGLRMAWTTSGFIGAIGALYEAGAKIAIVLNPDFNGIRKFTVAGNNMRVDPILASLNEREQGWGGPATGTILGSPQKVSSKLAIEDVVDIVKSI